MDELGLLERLVRKYSPSGHEGEAVREFVRIARELGYSCRFDAVGNGIARRGSGRPRIDFLGHIDTVEGPIPVRRHRGVLWGRGSVDAKGPLVAALLAGRSWAGPGEYRVVAAVGEETESVGARHILLGAPPNALIAGEPSGWDGITIAYKGLLRIEAVFRGSRTHYSSPHPTAMDRAVDWAGELRALVARRAGTTPFRSLTLKIVGLQSGPPGGEEVARMVVDLRLPPGRTTWDVFALLPRDGGRGSLSIRTRVEPVEVGSTNPVVRALVAGIRASGGRPTLWRKGGTSDMNLAVRAWGMPSAAYGPGDPRLDHTDRERISSGEIRRAVKTLEIALDRLRMGLATPRVSAAGA